MLVSSVSSDDFHYCILLLEDAGRNGSKCREVKLETGLAYDGVLKSHRLVAGFAGLIRGQRRERWTML